MTASPRHGIDDLAEGQAAPEGSVNENVRILEQCANSFLVTDRVTAPPGSPADGATYLIIATATGDFAGKENQLALRVGSTWHYVTPVEGTTAYVWDEDCTYQFTSVWQTVNADNAAVWAGSSNRRFLTPAVIYTASAPVALASAATVTPDGDNGFNFTLLLAHAATLANPSDFKVGQSGLIVITQDTGAPWTLAYGTNWKFPGGAPVLSTAAGAVDVLAYYVVSASLIVATLTKAYSS